MSSFLCSFQAVYYGPIFDRHHDISPAEAVVATPPNCDADSGHWLAWDSHFSQYGNSHTQETISNHEGRARAYLAKVGALLAEHNDNSTRDPLSNTSQTWIFGHEVGATALDAHTAVFIARLLDAQRENLIPAEVLKYGKPLLASKEWQGITQGRPTLHTVWEAQQSAPLGPGHA